MKKLALMVGVFTIGFGIYSTNVYADEFGCPEGKEWNGFECCISGYGMTDYTPEQKKLIDKNGDWVVGTYFDEDHSESKKEENADNQEIQTKCEEGVDCVEEETHTYTPPAVDASNPLGDYIDNKGEWWDECVDELIEEAEDDCEDACTCVNDPATEGDDCTCDCDFDEDDLALADIQSCYEDKAEDGIEDLLDDWGSSLNGSTTASCESKVRYKDMEWTIYFNGYQVREAVNNATVAYVLWDGEISYPGDSTHDPFYITGDMDMTKAHYIEGYYNSFESKVYPPLGYVDVEIANTNELFDFYIMVVDNPQSKYAGKYHIIPAEDIVEPTPAVDLEKVPYKTAKMRYSSEVTENRGTNYVKRLRYSDITYKRYYEIKTDWILRLYDTSGNEMLFGDGIDIKATDASWLDDLWYDNISNQAYGWGIGDSVLVSIKTSSDGTKHKNYATFPYDFYHLSDDGASGGEESLYVFGVNPHFSNMDSYYLIKSFEDILEKQQYLIDNQTTYGDTERGKIIIGNDADDESNVHVEVMQGLLYYTFSQPEDLTDMDENPTTLPLGQWKWYQHQNGVINQTFIVQPEVITIPGTENTRYFCLGQYLCDCPDPDVLCSCEDEEAGCPPEEASPDPEECPENGAKADNEGGCADGQAYCNEYGELVADNGRMIIIVNKQGYSVPSGGCGGITGRGSTDYYKNYVSASATLVE